MAAERHLSNSRALARPVSLVLFGITAAMVLCALLGFAFEHVSVPARPIDQGSHLAMLISAALAGGLGALTWWHGRDTAGVSLSRRQAAVVVNLIWGGVVFVGAIPYVVHGELGVVDALFESTSGFTTTGATVVADIEGSISHSLLLWRSLTQWLGGMGIVVLFVAVFPSLGVAGKHMLREEAPGHKLEALRPRATETAIVLWRFYLVFTLAEIVVLWLLGMSVFEAVNHAWTNVSTGGFSTRDGSIGAFDSPAIEAVVMVFMVACGVNFGLYYAALTSGTVTRIVSSYEFRVYLGILFVMVVALTLGTLAEHEGSPLTSLRYASFTAIAFLTGTGYGIDDYTLYPTSSLILMVIAMIVGGSSGSTTGGLKVSRMVILFESVVATAQRYTRPHVVRPIRLDRTVLDDSVVIDVAAVAFVYALCLLVGSMIVAVADNVPFQTILGAMLSALSNVGPAPFHIGADNFVGYSPVSKLVFCVAMIAGRLEFFTVLVLLVPDVKR